MNITIDEIFLKKSIFLEMEDLTENQNLNFFEHQKSSSEIQQIKKCLEKHFIFYNLTDQ